MSTEPTEEELNDLSKAFQKLWSLDENRLTPHKDYVLDWQGGKKYHQQERDTARRPLFKFVSPEVFEKPTYSTFYNLLDNYESSVGVEETADREEKRENWDFLNAVAETPVVQYVFNYLMAKGALEDDR